MQQYLLQDLSAVSAIPVKTFTKLVELSEYCISDMVNELDMSDDDLLELDIGLGTISILIVDDSVQYAFSPSSALEDIIVKTLEDKMTFLTDALERNLESKLLATYKELL